MTDKSLESFLAHECTDRSVSFFADPWNLSFTWTCTTCRCQLTMKVSEYRARRIPKKWGWFFTNETGHVMLARVASGLACVTYERQKHARTRI